MMKRRIAMILVASLMLVGCGSVKVKEIDEEMVGRQSSTEESSLEATTAEATEETTEVEEEKEVPAVDLLYNFLGVDGKTASAVSDVEISVDSYDGEHYFDYKVGDAISLEEIKTGISKSGWGDEMKLSYTFFYQDKKSPILAVLVPDNPNYKDENNCLLFFAVKDGEVHLVSYKDTMCDEYTYGYVGQGGLLSYKSQPLGRSSGNLLINKTYIVDKDGQLVDLFNETMAVASEAEYMGDDHRAFAIFAEMYADGNWSYVSVLECGADKYYVLYSDGSDTDLDARFIEACDKEGIKVYNRNELLPILNGYIQELGYEEDITDLDNKVAKWNELD
ncbi:hypothetical protein [Butyrivibrio sp. INlla18]|uniref:hypothetical protein n=1 Tax=Butyrivibrio sp. INlla18 TaxID=1520806 RepID=UPI0015A3B1D6|nr:hypothetical protein [Butyrivibrio sp. INlla18]